MTTYPLICLPRGTGVRAIWDAAGVPARVAFEASDPGVLAQLAARGLGVAILPGARRGRPAYADTRAARADRAGLARRRSLIPRGARVHEHARGSV